MGEYADLINKVADSIRINIKRCMGEIDGISIIIEDDYHKAAEVVIKLLAEHFEEKLSRNKHLDKEGWAKVPEFARPISARFSWPEDEEPPKTSD